MVLTKFKNTSDTEVLMRSGCRHPRKKQDEAVVPNEPHMWRRVVGAGINWALCYLWRPKSGTTGTSVQDTPRERREGQILEGKSVKSNGQWQETKPKERPDLTLE